MPPQDPSRDPYRGGFTESVSVRPPPAPQQPWVLPQARRGPMQPQPRQVSPPEPEGGPAAPGQSLWSKLLPLLVMGGGIAAGPGGGGGALMGGFRQAQLDEEQRAREQQEADLKQRQEDRKFNLDQQEQERLRQKHVMDTITYVQDNANKIQDPKDRARYIAEMDRQSSEGGFTRPGTISRTIRRPGATTLTPLQANNIIKNVVEYLGNDGLSPGTTVYVPQLKDYVPIEDVVKWAGLEVRDRAGELVLIDKSEDPTSPASFQAAILQSYKKGDVEEMERLLALSGRVAMAGSPMLRQEKTRQRQGKIVAQSMIDGIVPPVIFSHLRRISPEIHEHIAAQGFDLLSLQHDYTATVGMIRTLNNSQQVRLRQSASSVLGSIGAEGYPQPIIGGRQLPSLRDLIKEWDGTLFRPLNSVQLGLALRGMMGSDAQILARDMDSMISDVQAELAIIYQGGNSPTEKVIGLTERNIQTDDARDTILRSLDRVESQVKLRLLAIEDVSPITPGGGEVEYSSQLGKDLTRLLNATELRDRVKARIWSIWTRPDMFMASNAVKGEFRDALAEVQMTPETRNAILNLLYPPE